MYAQAVRTPPRCQNRGGKRIQSSAFAQCAKGCAFPDVQLDCIKYLKLGDPACGSGNFLTETYLSLRRLENEVLRQRIAADRAEVAGQIMLDFGGTYSIKVSISQFYGIEINDFAVTVAKTALWISEEQMIRETQEIIHSKIDFLPLKSYANIVQGNALRMDWEDVISPDRLCFIMGNPPFVGKKEQTKTQKADLLKVLGKLKGAGNLDYVTGWYAIASRMIAGKQTGVAFVSTNSITQGEQAPSFGKLLESENVTIRFAHRTFRWDSEANEKAHVHCVIIGFGNDAAAEKAIYVNDEKLSCSNINVYLLDAPSVIIESRTRTICDVPQISYGSMPIDDGHLILDEDARDALLAENENNNRFIRNYAGGAELLKNKARWCIWLHGCAPAEYKKSRFIMERISLTQKFRQSSSRPQTLALADTPMLFGEIRQPSTPMLAIPKVSSERRRYIPISYVNPETIINGSALIIPDADMYIFGVLTSNVHMAWMRVVAGRLKSDYQYSGNVVYNNFPWPSPALEQRQKIENTAQGILDARALYPDNTLADLYDPLTMPPELRKAHDRNNAAVMKAYGFPTSMSEAECVAALMRMYQELTSN